MRLTGAESTCVPHTVHKVVWSVGDEALSDREREERELCQETREQWQIHTVKLERRGNSETV